MLILLDVSELAFTAMATAVAKGVTKDAPYLNAWWRGNLAVAVLAAILCSDTALALREFGLWTFQGRNITYLKGGGGTTHFFAVGFICL